MFSNCNCHETFNVFYTLFGRSLYVLIYLYTYEYANFLYKSVSKRILILHISDARQSGAFNMPKLLLLIK